MPAPLLAISVLRAKARDGTVPARVRAQVDEALRKEDRNGKPFYELRLRDGTDVFSLKAWNSSPAFAACEELEAGDTVQVEGEFSTGAFGVEAPRWTMRPLTPDETAELFAGDVDSQAANEADFSAVSQFADSLTDPRLRAVCQAFLEEFGPRFRRAAAARFNHHAFRGGLVRHTAQMMSSANALCAVYPGLNRDLLLAGTLFHDSGKLWETCPPERGFDIPRDSRGELLGHINIGIELVNTLWRKLPVDQWKSLAPATEDVRLHLLHLIAAHHGTLEFGSPVEPKTPEAIALHHIDNLDAKLEMFAAAYAASPEVAPGVFERVRALNVLPLRPLPSHPTQLLRTEIS